MAEPKVPAPTSFPTLPIAGEEVSHREFGDIGAMRQSIFDNVVGSVKTKYPLENARYRLELADPHYHSSPKFSLLDQKKAIMQGQSLEHKLLGTWQLTDKTTGKVVDKKSGVVAHVPYVTDRGTYIYNGSEYTVANQMRLKPGVFARVKENGLIEAHVNVKPGTGPSFRVHMEPETGIFRLAVGQSNLKLYPILRSMGVSDKDIEQHWGHDLLQKNIEAEDPRAVARAFAKLVSTRADQEVGGVDHEAVQKIASVAAEATGLARFAPVIEDALDFGLNRTLLRKAMKPKFKLPLEDLVQQQKLEEAQQQKLAEEKEAQIGAKDSDRKWSQLWFRGKLVDSEHNGKHWVLLEVHKGLCEAAYRSLRDEGVDCEPKFENPHISVLRPDEVDRLRKKHGTAWKGAARIGSPMRFKLMRLVNLVPAGWTDKYDRVWFVECESPELNTYRKEMGCTALPIHKDTGHEQRFHVTFAVHRNTTKKAAELFTEKRAASLVGEEIAPPPGPRDPHGAQILNVFNKMGMDPEVTEATLGERHDKVSIPLILRTTKKLLNINNKKEEVDDRDSLAFQTLHTPEDFFAERIKKDAGQLGRKMLWRSTLRGNVQHIQTGALTPQIRSVLLKSGLGQPIEEINPMDAYDQNLRILRLGEGGIPSLEAVPDEARSVQPSHFGYLDPIRAPESEKMGVDSRVAHGTFKGSDGQFYSSMLNAKTGAPMRVSAVQASKSIVAFPHEMERPGDKVRAMVKSRQVEYVNKKDVDYVLPSTGQMFSATSNLVPLISGIKGGRLLMGAKYFIQALPLNNAEAPLVQNLSDKAGKSFDDIYGERVGAVRAKNKGVVTDMNRDGITVKYADGTKETHELYDNFPFNRKTFIHNTPTVKIGDRVDPGQLLARSNYTDVNGSMAVGTNLKTAYVPYQGLNFEDAIVISESAAKKLSSEHMYQHGLEADENIQPGRKEFMSIFPTKFKREQLSTINNEGLVKVGTKVKYGDPLVLALNKAQPSAVHRGHKAMFGDGSVTWGHEFEGTVTDVEKTKEGGWNVTVKAYAPSQEGDKLAGRYGDKGVISKIIPDHNMLHDKDGKPFDILLNPQGIISRVNPSQVFEALLGKIARVRGSAYKVPSFMNEELNGYVEKELKRAGLKSNEDLFDPTSGRKIPNVLTGERFIMKLHHTAESKGRGRDIGAYTSEGLPARGGEFGSKRVSSMEQNALLSHGATEVLRDAQIVRGQRNDDYWRAFRMGFTPPSPKTPFIYDKFLGYMKGAGINVKKDGNRLHLFALTDKDISKFSSGAITSSDTITGEKMSEVPGGLFDRGLTGGHNGDRWSHIQLHEPMPNPVMEEPIRQMLGMTQKQYEDVIAGKTTLHGKTGGAAVKEALSNIRLDSAIEHAKSTIKSGAKSKRDHAVKVLGYYEGMQRYGLRPEDMVLTKVPVVPPSMRPVTSFRNMTIAADANYLYKDLMMSNEALKKMKGVVGDEQLGNERLQLYNSFKAVSGLGSPTQPKLVEKKVKGLLAHVFGEGSPKVGMFQRRVLGSPVDVVGRATITPNPELDMDQVGLPESKAWTIYRPFIVRRLIRRGMPATEAAKAVANKSEVAMKAMQEEITDRPVIINRAPTLHRYGFMASWPVLTKGETLQLSPVVTNGFTADFDGDAMNYHVPVTESAVKDAIDKMMPSRNLRAVRDFKVHYTPKNEFLMGLHLASTADNRNEARVFKDKASAIAAYKRGEIDLGDRIVIKD